ncbi:MAG: four helix bundle protein [Prevotella sp.]|nr:four helix bundle protein [Prevotella sp.]
MAESVVYNLSKKFSLRIISLYQYLTGSMREYIMSKQVYRSGTSIGANLAESIFAQSKSDYISKLSIALKEASETYYWLEILHESRYLDDDGFNSLITDNKIIIGTLVNMINKLKKNGDK